MIRLVTILVLINVLAVVLAWLNRSPDLCAHSEYDRYALANAHCVESLDPYRCRGVL